MREATLSGIDVNPWPLLLKTHDHNTGSKIAVPLSKNHDSLKDIRNKYSEVVFLFESLQTILFLFYFTPCVPKILSMPASRASPTPWREKRRARGRFYDIKKKAKAEREQFCRGRRAVCKRAHNLYLDRLDTGREHRAYVLFFEKSKGQNRQGWYFTYNSHPDIAWIPHAEEVVSVCESWQAYSKLTQSK